MRKIPFAGIELTSQRVRRLRGEYVVVTSRHTRKTSVSLLYTIVPRTTITTPLLNEALADIVAVPEDCWDAVCAFCLPRETCPTDPSVGGPRKRTGLPNRLATFTSSIACHMLQNSSELLADGMSANALLCRRLSKAFCFCGCGGEVVSLRYVVGPRNIQNTDE